MTRLQGVSFTLLKPTHTAESVEGLPLGSRTLPLSASEAMYLWFQNGLGGEDEGSTSGLRTAASASLWVVGLGHVLSGCFWSCRDTCIGRPVLLETDDMEASRLAGRGWQRGNSRDRSELRKAYEEHCVLPRQEHHSPASTVPPQGPLICIYPNERTDWLSLRAAGPRLHTRSNTSLSAIQRRHNLLEMGGVSALHP